MSHRAARGLIWKVLLAIHILLILLWFALPFIPVVSTPARQSEYIQQTLRTGSQLTTVYQYDGSPYPVFFEHQGDYRPANYGSWPGHVFHWQLIQNSTASGVGNNITLRLGKPTGSGIHPDFGVEIDLTALAVKDPHFVTSDEAEIYIWKPGGDLSWHSWLFSSIPYADAVLFNHQAEWGFEREYLRLLVPNKGKVELWKNMPGWDEFNTSDIASIDDTDRASGLIASFSFREDLLTSEVTPPGLVDVIVDLPAALLPSRTFQIRSWILFFLTPMTWTFEFVFNALIYPAFLALVAGLYTLTWLLPIYAVVVLLCWSSLGRGTSLRQFIRQFWMTRFIACKIVDAPPPVVWGPFGPLEKGNWEDAGTSDSGRGSYPRSLSNPLDFFRSKSPLDDLLFTFEATRWMLRPLGKSSRASVEEKRRGAKLTSKSKQRS